MPNLEQLRMIRQDALHLISIALSPFACGSGSIIISDVLNLHHRQEFPLEDIGGELILIVDGKPIPFSEQRGDQIIENIPDHQVLGVFDDGSMYFHDHRSKTYVPTQTKKSFVRASRIRLRPPNGQIK